MSLDAMKQALAALEQYTNVVTSVNDPNSWVTVADGGKSARDAITALRAAIEQAQESVQVSPMEFAHMVSGEEYLVGRPVCWAEWPSKEPIPFAPVEKITEEEITEWTRQAGGFDATVEFLDRFANLVALAERRRLHEVKTKEQQK